MDQILPLAILVVIVILVVVGATRVMGRPRGTNEAFGAGGVTRVPAGTRGEVKTELAPSGVIAAVGEDWSARSRDGSRIAAGRAVIVTGQDGLVLLVDAASDDRPATGATPA